MCGAVGELSHVLVAVTKLVGLFAWQVEGVVDSTLHRDVEECTEFSISCVPLGEVMCLCVFLLRMGEEIPIMFFSKLSCDIKAMV